MDQLASLGGQSNDPDRVVRDPVLDDAVLLDHFLVVDVELSVLRHVKPLSPRSVQGS
ncbi:hypothetical protein [Halalkalicoccus salilacus]|uniref:hypothetical protein n=1 Tax=Halalkalicoccus sp. GCM10025704 TaxID=3252662 RepID=UPI00360C03F8